MWLPTATDSVFDIGGDGYGFNIRYWRRRSGPVHLETQRQPCKYLEESTLNAQTRS